MSTIRKEPWHESYGSEGECNRSAFHADPGFRSLYRIFCQDGSVLLAKYLEHQAVAMRRDFDSQRSRRQTRPNSAAFERAEGDDGDSFSRKARAVDRVLELGCGTGLAGLAAAFSFGRRESGDKGNESTAAPPRPARRSNACEGEHYGVIVECGSSSTVEDGVEVVLTDLEYALENARANIGHNAPALKAVGSTVNAMELDWCRPLPEEFAGKTMTPSCSPAIPKEW